MNVEMSCTNEHKRFLVDCSTNFVITQYGGGGAQDMISNDVMYARGAQMRKVAQKGTKQFPVDCRKTLDDITQSDREQPQNR